MNREKYTIGEGEFETPVYELDGDKDGETTVVVGGQHGNEVSSVAAGDLIRLWEINRGTIIVIPRANPPACNVKRRSGSDGKDMNRSWPAGKTPTHPQSRAIWNLITDNDADYIFDLHRSAGVYRGTPKGVGMAIYSTPRARSAANYAIGDLNRRYVPKGVPSFRHGNAQNGDNPLLSHKVGADLEPPAHGWLVETTSSNGNSMFSRVQQLERAVERILYHATDKKQVVVNHNHHEQEPNPSVLKEYDEGDGGDKDNDRSLSGSQQKAVRVIKKIQNEFDISKSDL